MDDVPALALLLRGCGRRREFMTSQAYRHFGLSSFRRIDSWMFNSQDRSVLSCAIPLFAGVRGLAEEPQLLPKPATLWFVTCLGHAYAYLPAVGRRGD